MKNVQVSVFVFATIASGVARAQETFDLVSTTPSGRFGNGDSIGPAVSGSGRFIAFASFASDLVPGDTNGTTDLFVRDLDLGITERVSVTDSGAQVAGAWTSGAWLGISTGAAISHDGSIVSFTTTDPSVVAGDTNGVTDLFVRDRTSGRTERVSLRPDGGEFVGHCGAAQICADGRRILFAHRLTQANPYVLEWYVRDRATGVTQLVSVVPDGSAIETYAIQFATGGRYVVFQASRMAPPFAYGTFVRDLETGITVAATPYSDWRAYNAASVLIGSRYDEISPLAVSASGRFILCESFRDLDPTDGLDTDWRENAWVLDRTTSTFRLATRFVGDTLPHWTPQFDPFSGFAHVSDDGRTVRLRASSYGLIGLNYDNEDPFYEVDLETTQMRVLSLNWRMIPFEGYSNYPNRYSTSSDGDTLAVQIVEGSSGNPMQPWGTSSREQIYVRRVRAAAGVTFCAGDGSGASCPCGTPGIAGRGCANAWTARGSVLETRGNASLADDSLTFLAYDASYGLSFLMQSTGAAPAGGVPFEGGVLCVATPALRIGIDHPYEDDLGVLKRFGRGAEEGARIHDLGAVGAPGTRYYQVWTRAVGGTSCVESRSSLTNGVRVEWRL